jgi:hypothetical protein
MIKIVNVKVVKYKIVIKENKRVKQLHLAQDVITVFSQQRLTTSRISFTTYYFCEEYGNQQTNK